MIVEHLKHEGTSHSSRDLLKICVKMGASWSAQTFRQEGDTPSGPGAFLIFCLWKILFADPECRWGVSGEGWGSGRGCRWLFDVRVGEGCEWWLIKPAVKHIQVVSQLVGFHSVGGWSPVICDAPPHWSQVVLEKALIQLFSVALLCYSDLLHQCVPGLVVQDSVPTSIGLLLGLTKLPELCCKPAGWHTHVLTKTDVQCHSVSEFIQVCGCSFKNTPISAVKVGL